MLEGKETDSNSKPFASFPVKLLIVHLARILVLRSALSIALTTPARIPPNGCIGDW
jgi:hypothetical protein